jgi:ankyrin repeat protein
MSLSKKDKVNSRFFQLCSVSSLIKVKDYFNLNYAFIDVNYEFGNRTPLIMAIYNDRYNNRYNVVEFLITVCGADVNHSVENITPLFTAIEYNRVKIVKLLLDNGVDTDVKNRAGRTTLVMAIECNLYDIVECLITVGGVDVNHSERYTPLFCALECRNFKVVKLLLNNGANTDVRNWKGQTPLDIASIYAPTEIIAMLKSPMIKSANKV